MSVIKRTTTGRYVLNRAVIVPTCNKCGERLSNENKGLGIPLHNRSSLLKGIGCERCIGREIV